VLGRSVAHDLRPSAWLGGTSGPAGPLGAARRARCGHRAHGRSGAAWPRWWGNHGGAVVVVSDNKRGGGAHRGIPTSMRQRRCFGRRHSPWRWCSGDRQRPQVGPAARCGGGRIEGLPDRGKRERGGQAHCEEGNGGTTAWRRCRRRRSGRPT
jgi:hypothetical protein